MMIVALVNRVIICGGDLCNMWLRRRLLAGTVCVPPPSRSISCTSVMHIISILIHCTLHWFNYSTLPSVPLATPKESMPERIAPMTWHGGLFLRILHAILSRNSIAQGFYIKPFTFKIITTWNPYREN